MTLKTKILDVIFLSMPFAVPLSKAGGEGIVVESLLLSEWLLTKSVFDSAEPIIVQVRLTNLSDDDEELALCPGNRGGLTVEDSAGLTVWNTDQAKELEEQRLVKGRGFGRIEAGPTCHRMVLGPNEVAIWQDSWNQQDLNGTPVLPGTFSLTLAYRFQIMPDGSYREIRTKPVIARIVSGEE